jgi:hypothetical protein
MRSGSHPIPDRQPAGRQRRANRPTEKPVNHLPLSKTIVRRMTDLGPMHAPRFAPNIVILMAAFPSRLSHDF